MASHSVAWRGGDDDDDVQMIFYLPLVEFIEADTHPLLFFLLSFLQLRASLCLFIYGWMDAGWSGRSL